MRFKVVSGEDGSPLIYAKTDGWEAVNYNDVAQHYLLYLFKEDRKYPPPRFEGRQKLIRYFHEIGEIREGREEDGLREAAEHAGLMKKASYKNKPSFWNVEWCLEEKS